MVLEPSTYASIILLYRQRLCLSCKQRFVPSDKGRMVCHLTIINKYIDYNFTAQLETELDDISNGSVDWKTPLLIFGMNFLNTQGKETSIRGILLPKPMNL